MARPRIKLQRRTLAKLEKILRFELLGKTPTHIAKLMGMAVCSIRELQSHPEAVQMRERLAERVYAPIDEEIRRRATEVLDEAAPDAAEALSELVHSDDLVTRRLASTAVLDRTGHGPIRRRAVRQRHELDPATIELMREAMREADMTGVGVSEGSGAAEVLGPSKGPS